MNLHMIKNLQLNSVCHKVAIYHSLHLFTRFIIRNATQFCCLET